MCKLRLVRDEREREREREQRDGWVGGAHERDILYGENTVCERGWVGLYFLWSVHREDGIDMRERNIIHVELTDLLGV